MTLRASKPAFNVREKLTELGRRFGLKGSELAAAETAQDARDLVSAGRKNLIFNGDMQVAQRVAYPNTQPAVQYENIYACDRWNLAILGGNFGTWTVSQSNIVPSGQGFARSLKLDCTTAQASPAANAYLLLDYRIEGQNLQSLKKGTPNAEQSTLSFWVRCTKSGDMQVNLRDADNTRVVGKKVTIHTANAWEKKVVTFPADTTGAYDNDNNESMRIQFWLDAGSNYKAAAVPEQWEGMDNNELATACNLALADSTSNDFYITGVQYEVGPIATEFEHRSYGEELVLCQRYYYKSPSHYHFLHKNGYYETQLFYFPTTMRDSPDVSVPTPVVRRVDGSSNISYTGLSISRYPDGFYLSSTTTNNNLFYTFIMSGAITADAEL